MRKAFSREFETFFLFHIYVFRFLFKIHVERNPSFFRKSYTVSHLYLLQLSCPMNLPFSNFSIKNKLEDGYNFFFSLKFQILHQNIQHVISSISYLSTVYRCLLKLMLEDEYNYFLKFQILRQDTKALSMSFQLLFYYICNGYWFLFK